MEKPKEIRMVSVDKIDPNPYRDLPSYPVIRSKVDALKASFAVVGVWPSIIVRPYGDRVQQAFGHMRMEAAREMKLKEVPVIVSDLNDMQMVQYMGRENGEDYNADFRVMLNTWEAAVKYLRAARAQNPKPIDIARLLGWTRANHDGGDRLDDIAIACANALSLIEQGYLERETLADISVRAARDIVARGVSRMESIDRAGKLSGATAADVSQAKSMVGKGVQATAKEARSGTVPVSQIGSRVDVNTLNVAGRSKGKKTPLFAAFGRALVDSISKILDKDAAADKLAEVAKALNLVVDEDDRVILRQLDFQLGEVSSRADRWRKRLATNKVKPFPAPVQIGGPK